MKITCAADLEGLSFPYQLQGADLSGADLSDVLLKWAKLNGANLAGAILQGASLWETDLAGANLRLANLRWANLAGANLAGANLRWANLRWANLEGANLEGANLEGANLEVADLEGTKLPEFLVKLPPLGQSFIAWKRVCFGFVLKLEIPADSPRVSTFIGRKCRAKSAKVLEAFARSGESTEETAFRSLRNYDFVYRIGETVEVPDFDDDIRVECTQGIHFFETREEAESYR